MRKGEKKKTKQSKNKKKEKEKEKDKQRTGYLQSTCGSEYSSENISWISNFFRKFKE